MTNSWRVVMITLLVAAVVFAGCSNAGKNKTPAGSTSVAQETVSPPAAEKPEPAKPEVDKEKPAVETPKADEEKQVEKASVKTEDPAKKPETAKPSKPEKVVAKPKGLPKIIDIGGDSCIPCKLMLPILDGLRSDYKGKLEVITISKDKDPGAMKRYKISTIPVQILYDANGKEIERHFGFFAKEDIIEAFKKHGIEL